MTEKYDAIIIGAGQAGPGLAVRLADEGMQTVLIERCHLGGSCVNFGCTPTKTLVASARAAHMARRAADFGVVLNGQVRVDMRQIKQRKDALVAASRDGLREWLQGTENLTLLEGHGRFVERRRVRVGDRELEAPRIFVNTGTRGVIPPIPGLDSIDYLTASGMLELEHLPEHLLILGGGYVGVEYAQMFRRFGSRVSLIQQHARLLPHEDTDVSETVQQILEAEGVEVLTAVKTLRVETRDNTIRLALDGVEHSLSVEGSHLLVATGRRPNSDDLDLRATALETDERGYIPVDDKLRTAVSGIWALGDVNGRGAFTHTAYDDYTIVVNNLFGDASLSLERRIPAYAVYLDPPLARVGMTETRVRELKLQARIARLPMGEVARARERDETRGFLKILVSDTDQRILGASFLGIGADEAIHGILDLMYADAPISVLQRSVPIHPTVSELIPSLLQRLEPLEDSV